MTKNFLDKGHKNDFFCFISLSHQQHQGPGILGGKKGGVTNSSWREVGGIQLCAV